MHDTAWRPLEMDRPCKRLRDRRKECFESCMQACTKINAAPPSERDELDLVSLRSVQAVPYQMTSCPSSLCS
jgi:hypothetical protein